MMSAKLTAQEGRKMMNLTTRPTSKKYETRNTRGAQRMADNGQKVPFWMGCYHQMDNLSWGAKSIARYKWGRYLQNLANANS